MLGVCLGANNIPQNASQYRCWVQNLLPHGKAIHHFGFTAICWAIWKCRNIAIFDKKLIITPLKSLYTHVCICLIGQVCLALKLAAEWRKESGWCWRSPTRSFPNRRSSQSSGCCRHLRRITLETVRRREHIGSCWIDLRIKEAFGCNSVWSIAGKQKSCYMPCCNPLGALGMTLCLTWLAWDRVGRLDLRGAPSLPDLFLYMNIWYFCLEW